MEETAQESKEKKDDFAKFVQETVRGPKRGILETSICQHLALSINSKSLNSIYHICSAALKLTHEERQKLEINMEELEVLFTVTLAFLNALTQRKKYLVGETYWHVDYETREYCQIIWGFRETIKNYEKYIEPWNQLGNFTYESIAMPSFTQEKETSLKEEIHEIGEKAQKLIDQLSKQTENSELKKKIDELKKRQKVAFYQQFYLISKYLSPDAFAELQNHFLNWALPKAQVIFNKLSSHVNPDVYSRVLELYVKKGEGKEEISEAQL